MIDVGGSLKIIGVVALLTILIRFLPFMVFRNENKMPKWLQYFGTVLPGAVMGMLVVYCFRSTTVLSWPYALPEIIAAVLVVGLYLWRKNTLIAITIGTIAYMVMVQSIFV